MTHLVEQKICFVTGAGQGIGKAIARRLHDEGAVVYCNATSSSSLAWLNDEPSDRLIPLPFDITDADACRLGIQTIKRNSKRLDVLINNAGVEYNELIGFFDRSHRDHMFQVNVYAALELLQLAARIMQRQKSGSIINLSSKVGLCGNPGQTVYAATKGAINALTKSAAKELAPHGIRVNAVAPGLTQTNMLEQADPEKLKARIDRIGMGRLAMPEDIANTCLFLASDLSSYLTGQIIEVEGAATL